MTPEEILDTLANRPKSIASLKVQSYCGSTVSMASLASLWRIAHGMNILGKRYRFLRAKLRKCGYATSVSHPEGLKGANHKPLPVYALTPDGERVIAKLRDELTKISERIKRKANA